MADEMKTAANWAKELGMPEKALKEALKGKEPDAKKGCCSYWTRASIDAVARKA